MIGADMRRRGAPGMVQMPGNQTDQMPKERRPTTGGNPSSAVAHLRSFFESFSWNGYMLPSVVVGLGEEPYGNTTITW